jgi:hypothetical protein
MWRSVLTEEQDECCSQTAPVVAQLVLDETVVA